MAVRIEVGINQSSPDPAGDGLRTRIASDLKISVGRLRILDVFTIDKPLDAQDARRLADELFADPINQQAFIDEPFPLDFDQTIEVGFLPGVTDNVGRTAREAVADLLGVEFSAEENVYFSRRFCFSELGRDDAEIIAGWLANPLIERSSTKTAEEFKRDGGINMPLPKVRLKPNYKVDEVDLEVSDEELLLLGKEGIPEIADGKVVSRRGPLALDLESLITIREHYRGLGRKPTDVELESIAQTWSEHCKHRIFAARIDEVDSLYRTYIKGATNEIRRRLGPDDWCVSVFSDNSGIIRFTEKWNICHKVETHNSPSALDPYGGAITGIVGVNRDALGAGKGALLVANMYGFCFADPYYDKKLPCRDADLKVPILHPKVIFEGVRRGVEHGGNKSGIPTPYGFIRFDNRYMGKPLVFVGTVGLLPRVINDQPSEDKKARAGDVIVMAGGKIGADGIHGATFSSESLHSGSPVGAVQIGDPITQKKLGDAQLEARDLDLYSSVTDCGAGGISCSVGEMARESGGCLVELDKAPLKYPGLAPYEIWISESQERMTYAVPPENLDRFLDLFKKRDVEAWVVGRFTDDGRCTVTFDDNKIMDLDLDFFHDGVPGLKLNTEVTPPATTEPELPQSDLGKDLIELVGRLNLSSREYVSRQYDHEVQAGSVIKPLIGAEQDVMSDAAVFRPLHDAPEGVAISAALHPSYGDIDYYAMGACAIDTAIRNLVAVGANPKRIALLDNFCWCSSDQPDRLGQLKAAAQACYDVALEFMTPFISGKDSMFNDFKGFDAGGEPVKISAPPTLLISSIGVVDDVAKSISADFKFAGDTIFAIGATRNELGGSEYYAMVGERRDSEPWVGRNVPHLRTAEAVALYPVLAKAIDEELVASAVPAGVGGIAYALAKSCMGGRLGADIDLASIPIDGKINPAAILFSESVGRFIVSVAPQNVAAFSRLFADFPVEQIGRTTDSGSLKVSLENNSIIDAPVDALVASYKQTLDW